MSKSLRIALLTLIAVVIAYPGAAWLIGLQVQSQLQRDQQRLLGANGSVAVVSTRYYRGIFHSSEQITYEPAGPLAQLLHRADPQRPLDAWRMSVLAQIHHGPLPQWRAFGLASVDSQVLLPAPLQRAVQGELAGRAILQVHSLLGWLGDSRSQLMSPSLRYRFSDGSTLVWSGLTGSAITGERLERWTLALAAPGLSLQGPEGHAELAGFALQATVRRVFDTLYVGQTHVQLQSLQLAARAGTASFALRGLSYESNSSLNDQYINQSGQLSADTMQVGQFSATRIGYAQTVSHLHGPSLAALVRALREAQQAAGSGPPDRARMLGAFRQYGVELALHQPVLDISRVGFATPQGELRLSAKISMPGIGRQDLTAQGVAAFAALATHLNMTADLSVEQALAERLISGSARTPLYTAQIQQLVQQGYLRQQGNAYLCHLSYEAGHLSINGLPFPPRPPARAP